MKVSQLEQLYRDGMSRVREQRKKQEREQLHQAGRRIREEQKAVYEQKLESARAARAQEMRLLQEELARVCDQAVSLRKRIDGMMEQES